MNDSSEDENAASQAEYESDYSYCGDESDNITTTSTGWVSEQKRPSAFPRDETANTMRSSYMDDIKFVMSSEQCHQCLQERHHPVSCCTKVASWLQRRHQLWTVSPQVLQECVTHFIQIVANRANISVAEAGILCRNEEWNLDLMRNRRNRRRRDRNDGLLELVRMRERNMEEMAAVLLLQQAQPDQPINPFIHRRADAYEDMAALLLQQAQPDQPIDLVIRRRADAYEADGNNALDDPMIENRAAAGVETTVPPSQIQHDADLKRQVRISLRVPNVNETDNEEGTHIVAPFAGRHPSEPATTSFGSDGTKASNINTDEDSVMMNSSGPYSTPEDQQFVNLLLTCPICLEDDLAPDSMYAMKCGHRFCLVCWLHLVRTILGEIHQVAMHSTCPEENCECMINEVVIQAVAPECMPLFENHQRHSFVLGIASTVRWCPGPNCDQVAILPRNNLFEDNIKDFCCGKCSTSFCFTCLRTPHQGICQPHGVMPDQRPEVAMARAVYVDAADLMDTRDDKLRKHCPSCKAPVEKNGGCNRMVCRCRHAFCWLCLGDYRSYGNHFCGGTQGRRVMLDEDRKTVDLEFLREALRDKPTDDELAKRTQLALEELDRYAHYYNRYYSHKQGQAFAEGLCPCIAHRKEHYTQMSGFQTGNEVDFVQSANETLVASRRMLKYAYISAFYSKRVDEEDNEHSHLGFLHLESLEGFTEELSGVSENALTRRDRARVLDLIAVVTKCMGLLADFELHENVANARE